MAGRKELEKKVKLPIDIFEEKSIQIRVGKENGINNLQYNI